MKAHKVLNKILHPSLFVLFMLFLPVFVQAEEIELFESRIELNSDSSFTVTENITYNLGSTEHHGIIRNVSHRHPQPASKWYKKRSIELEVLSVTRNGEEERYVVTESDDQTDIKIGKAEETITGQYIYQIVYRVTGGLSYLDGIGVTEVYWNVTGNGWQVPIKQAIGIVGPADKLATPNECYKGSLNSTLTCDEKNTFAGGVSFRANNLAPHEGLTIASELKGQWPVVTHEKLIKLYIIIPIIFLTIGVLIWRVYLFVTYHKPGSRTIIPQYTPYQNVLPMFSGVLSDGRLDGRDITAGLLYLAQTGFIKIRRTERKAFFFINLNDYEITLLKDVDLADDSVLPSNFHHTILSLLFTVMSKGTIVQLSDIQKSQSKQRKNYAILMTLKKSVIKDLIERGFYETKLGIRRKTAKGYEAVWYLKGFKEFLKVTDEERFKFHNAPAKSPEQFMQYLPYAVAFGVEKEWSAVFKDIAIEQPEWYDEPVGSFSAASLGDELGAIATAVNVASGSGYSSRSSAGGGGGFSGGGGGGGGGGSW